MKLNHFLYLSTFGLKTIFLKQRKSILGTIILTDYCNLTCKHCAVNNINKVIHPYNAVLAEMQQLYREGIRILFFCGGETLMWQDGDKDIRFLVKKAKEIGFFIVNIVTNGTINLDIPEADTILLSLDGGKETHNAIRGDTYDTILQQVALAKKANICIYMAINRLNYTELQQVTDIARDNQRIKAISFNFHTPYPGTEALSLTALERQQAVNTIKRLIDEGYPIFNLKAGLDAFLRNDWQRPCWQCVVVENGRKSVCGRCIEVEGLCRECGYLFAIEFSLLFSGNIKVIFEMLRTYLRYV